MTVNQSVIVARCYDAISTIKSSLRGGTTKQSPCSTKLLIGSNQGIASSRHWDFANSIIVFAGSPLVGICNPVLMSLRIYNPEKSHPNNMPYMTKSLIVAGLRIWRFRSAKLSPTTEVDARKNAQKPQSANFLTPLLCTGLNCHLCFALFKVFNDFSLGHL